MTRQGRAIVVGVAAFAIFAIGVAGVAVVFQMRERDARLAKERELLLVKAENEDLEEQLLQIRQTKEQVETELALLKDQMTQMTKQLTEEQQAKDALATSIDERQREIDRLNKDLAQARSERGSLAEQVTTLKGEQEALQAQLAKAEQAKTELETKVLELSEHPSVELEKVIVTSASPSAASSSQLPATQGQVVVVNREYDFIVMNLGKRQGLALGQEFQIVRGQQVLGRVKVEKVYDELSAAAILPESNKDAIREGDLVKAL